ncbi:G2 and S phase-expressed protein 1 isoform X2 [Amphiprion ocellaris]|uniref:G2 and S phase-expressed protein 1 isoform X2 n=1 Tax=Amphiprion ocellaris TaxID=80972 RepID=UPI0024116FB3|nr:G2 and S phase-expressed protein 1 isoform X2 [Amphiprion ocellaris]
MDSRANSDVFFLLDEKFDFDVSMSPASSIDDDDEDEVFVGPVSHKEKCVSAGVVSRLQDGSDGVRVSWSPLSGDQLEAVCQEATKLANQLQSGESHSEDTDITDTTTEREEFVEDSKAKLGVLGQTASALSPIKRQTFCVQDSPMKELPPAIQRSLLRGNSSTRPSVPAASSTRPSVPATSSTLPSAPATSSTLPSASATSSTRPSVPATSSTRPSASATSSTRPSAPATSSTRPSASATSSTRPSAPATSSTRPSAPATSSTRPTTRLSTSSPVVGPKAPSRMSLRGKAALGVAVVLPSKPAAPTTSCSASKSKVEKTRLQPPRKVVGGLRQSPSSRLSSRAESNEDLLSDSASVASDISDSSLNSSLLGKRTLAPPTKSVGVRNLSGVKAPPLQSRRVTDRKNTSSSSSSVSSFNSSMSLSPAKGKPNSSLNGSLSSSTGLAPSSVSRPRRSTVYTAAEPASSTAGRRSLSTQGKKLSETERVKAARATPLKRAEATPLQSVPAKRLLERTSSSTASSGRPQSGLKPKSKPEALVPPTPSTSGKGAHLADDVSKGLKPKRLMSTSSVDSLPQKTSAGSLTPSASSSKSLQMKARRPSALPTPVKRRMSAIPAPTPTNQTRTVRPPAISNSGSAPTPTSARKQHSYSPLPTDTQQEELTEAVHIQPFCLEEEEEEEEVKEEDLPTPLSNTEQPNQSESADPEAPSQDESVPNRNLMELETTEESNSKTQEVLLLDLPPPALHPQEKLLIDLTNTPDLVRTSNKTCSTTQLIDLSSPLIKWSPDDKRENALLINLSF